MKNKKNSIFIEEYEDEDEEEDWNMLPPFLRKKNKSYLK